MCFSHLATIRRTLYACECVCCQAFTCLHWLLNGKIRMKCAPFARLDNFAWILSLKCGKHDEWCVYVSSTAAKTAFRAIQQTMWNNKHWNLLNICKWTTSVPLNLLWSCHKSATTHTSHRLNKCRAPREEKKPKTKNTAKETSGR